MTTVASFVGGNGARGGMLPQGAPGNNAYKGAGILPQAPDNERGAYAGRADLPSSATEAVAKVVIGPHGGPMVTLQKKAGADKGPKVRLARKPDGDFIGGLVKMVTFVPEG